LEGFEKEDVIGMAMEHCWAGPTAPATVSEDPPVTGGGETPLPFLELGLLDDIQILFFPAMNGRQLMNVSVDLTCRL